VRLIPDNVGLHFPHSEDCSDPFSNPMTLLSDSVSISDEEWNNIVNLYYGDVYSKSQMNRKVEQKPFSVFLKDLILLKLSRDE
jgi:hypothetical protein